MQIDLTYTLMTMGLLLSLGTSGLASPTNPRRSSSSERLQRAHTSPILMGGSNRNGPRYRESLSILNEPGHHSSRRQNSLSQANVPGPPSYDDHVWNTNTYAREEALIPSYRRHSLGLGSVGGSTKNRHFPFSDLKDIIHQVDHKEQITRAMSRFMNVPVELVKSRCDHHKEHLDLLNIPSLEGMGDELFRMEPFVVRMCAYHDNPSGSSDDDRHYLQMEALKAYALSTITHAFAFPSGTKTSGEVEEDGFPIEIREIAFRLSNVYLQLKFPRLFLERQRRTWGFIAREKLSNNPPSALADNEIWKARLSKHFDVMKSLEMKTTKIEKIITIEEGPRDIWKMYHAWKAEITHLSRIIWAVQAGADAKISELSRGDIHLFSAQVTKSGHDLLQKHIPTINLELNDRKTVSEKLNYVEGETKRMREVLITLSASMTDALIRALERLITKMQKPPSGPKTLIKAISQTSDFKKHSGHYTSALKVAATVLFAHDSELAIPALYPSTFDIRSTLHNREATPLYQEILQRFIVWRKPEGIPRDDRDKWYENLIDALKRLYGVKPTPLLPLASIEYGHLMGFKAISIKIAKHTQSSDPPLTEVLSRTDVAWVIGALKKVVELNSLKIELSHLLPLQRGQVLDSSSIENIQNYLNEGTTRLLTIANTPSHLEKLRRLCVHLYVMMFAESHQVIRTWAQGTIQQA
ncbi:hypothetical protein BJ684DRAFT_15199 [Piptocephalis cylindrospora]|uniref:T-complex protein 11-domain-containing protein n=1 Tax=Piptocephalis cylindrospora TaxID=1907219 RepID=A0A4P9Y600_9FUNG|nr:hypothetical protein BJ684DRAFT_15199 [Piptocephalis cylindrospora]|eukprot:RKP14478.1 hypothetical protein BJ684DRAFT_15199 [Piptocephalis cylindrospora]